MAIDLFELGETFAITELMNDTMRFFFAQYKPQGTIPSPGCVNRMFMQGGMGNNRLNDLCVDLHYSLNKTKDYSHAEVNKYSKEFLISMFQRHCQPNAEKDTKAFVKLEDYLVEEDHSEARHACECRRGALGKGITEDKRKNTRLEDDEDEDLENSDSD
ncbi:hypothetical protein BDV95DRAFT_384832 [Massariosphaeria phaeospora]|uniref:Uncharacterized protein n=1 Tax=Massariosphaeria phaeospora TaxID=100035 RepID=A0A7C8MBH1_9PLEO|nr:hypothetical protein BDV95DRAFT_384832 [Massariosphaeria phaeospora]